jgi:L-malate glycosyltransferase
MHILMIPSWYGTEDQPILGSFFHEHALAMHSAGIHMGVIYPEIRQLRRLTPRLLLRHHFQSSSGMEGPLPTCRLHGWNLFPKWMKMQREAWCFFAEKLFTRYCQLYGIPDLIHAQSSVWAGMAAAKISKKRGVPYCITEHASVFMKQAVLGTPWDRCWSTPYIREAFDGAATVVAVSQALKEALRPYTSNQIQVIPNLVDTHFFKPQKQPKREIFHFLTLSYLVPRKRIDLLLCAFKRLGEGHLTIGGDGPERQRLEKLAQVLGIASRVTFLGALSREKARSAYQEADVFVLASQHETFGVVCIEAIASGIPVIATRSGGTEDIVDEQVGYLVPVNDEEALATAMARIQTATFDPDNLHQIAQQRYSPEVIAREYRKLYGLYIDERQRAGSANQLL